MKFTGLTQRSRISVIASEAKQSRQDWDCFASLRFARNDQSSLRKSCLIIAWGLDRGESEVLSFALENTGYRAIIDDAAARRVAKTLNIPFMGKFFGGCGHSDRAPN